MLDCSQLSAAWSPECTSCFGGHLRCLLLLLTDRWQKGKQAFGERITYTLNFSIFFRAKQSLPAVDFVWGVMTLLFLTLNISPKVLKSKVYILNSGLVGLSIRQSSAGVISCNSSSRQLFIEKRCKEKCVNWKEISRAVSQSLWRSPRKTKDFWL